jgi:hypothetical protein
VRRNLHSSPVLSTHNRLQAYWTPRRVIKACPDVAGPGGPRRFFFRRSHTYHRAQAVSAQAPSKSQPTPSAVGRVSNLQMAPSLISASTRLGTSDNVLASIAALLSPNKPPTPVGPKALNQASAQGQDLKANQSLMQPDTNPAPEQAPHMEATFCSPMDRPSHSFPCDSSHQLLHLNQYGTNISTLPCLSGPATGSTGPANGPSNSSPAKTYANVPTTTHNIPAKLKGKKPASIPPSQPTRRSTRQAKKTPLFPGLIATP